MFGENATEYSKKQGKDIPVWQSPKYIEAKAKAKELIESKKYDLVEGDFWILMNETKTGKMGYTGLIISHNGCLKINDKLDNKVNPKCFTCDKEGYKSSLVYTYCDDDVYEVGEVSASNCKNDYPYAMAFKRCFDRVVLKKCKLAYAGVYSDSEAEEFRKDEDETVQESYDENEIKPINKSQVSVLQSLIKDLKSPTAKEFYDHVLKDYDVKNLEELTNIKYGLIVKEIQEIKGE